MFSSLFLQEAFQFHEMFYFPKTRKPDRSLTYFHLTSWNFQTCSVRKQIFLGLQVIWNWRKCLTILSVFFVDVIFNTVFSNDFSKVQKQNKAQPKNKTRTLFYVQLIMCRCCSRNAFILSKEVPRPFYPYPHSLQTKQKREDGWKDDSAFVSGIRVASPPPSLPPTADCGWHEM